MSYLYTVVRRDDLASFGWPGSARERARLEAELLAVLEPALAAAADLAQVPRPPAVAPWLAEFLAVYGRRPLADNKGGSGLNDSLWLYCLARLLAPALIVESGTWRGQSAWLFRQAAPDAPVITFDVAVPAEGRCTTPGVTYCLEDWSRHSFAGPLPARTLAFFDDHLSHARRLVEAAARGPVRRQLRRPPPACDRHAAGADAGHAAGRGDAGGWMHRMAAQRQDLSL